MNNKKQYIQPTIKCVEFKMERGFASSLLGQGFNDWGEKPSNLTYENFSTYYEGRPFRSEGPNGGYFTDNTDDWD